MGLRPVKFKAAVEEVILGEKAEHGKCGEMEGERKDDDREEIEVRVKEEDTS